MKFDQRNIDAFAARLADARAAAGLPRRAIVEAVDGISEPQQIYNYENGRRAPDRIDVVLGLERAVGLERGTLCRLLGFAPLDSAGEPPTVEDAIAADDGLSREAKVQLLSAYRRVAQVPPRSRH
ncbi:MAG: helix-turn-helix domain-containing protein [Nitriliruptoraceae bacterium]